MRCSRSHTYGRRICTVSFRCSSVLHDVPRRVVPQHVDTSLHIVLQFYSYNKEVASISLVQKSTRECGSDESCSSECKHDLIGCLRVSNASDCV